MSDKNLRHESDYWDDFYAHWEIDIPSQFCVMLATEADKTRPVVEFGCGNGRDSIYLARHGFHVTALDLSEEAIRHNQQKADRMSSLEATFICGDVTSSNDVSKAMNQARVDDMPLNIYSRFFLHTLDDEQEQLFLTALSAVTHTGDNLYLEFRCDLDANIDKLFEGHFRRYVETDKLVESLQQQHGFSVSYRRTGQGMAKYKHEDPFVSRIIATRT